MINKKFIYILFISLFLMNNVLAEEIDLDLIKGWNLVSVPLEIEDNHPREVFGDTMDDIIRIYTFNPREGALIFIPELPDTVNTIREIDPSHGYWIRMKNDRTVTIEGRAVESIQIGLRRGFNLIGYIGETRNTEEVFGQIDNKLEKVVGFETRTNNPNKGGGVAGGKLYMPSLPSQVQSLKLMVPKLGYWVVMKDDAVLNYQELNSSQGALFRMTDGSDIFVINITDSEKIQEARDILSGRQTDATHVMGIIAKNPVDYNPPWSYHLEPETISFFEYAVEVCDASIQYVEDNLEEVGGALLPGNRWCPWGSRLIEEVNV